MIGLSVEYSSADVKEFSNTGVHFRVDVVKLLKAGTYFREHLRLRKDGIRNAYSLF